MVKFLFSCLLFVTCQTEISGQYTERMRLFLNSFTQSERDLLVFPFNDAARLKWRRTPGYRNGIAIFQMNEIQKRHLHLLLSSTLTSTGYSKVCHVMFNEDLSKEFDPETGFNRYWIAVYGKPVKGEKWSWRLEGHHLSLHFTFMGDSLIATTPFEIGCYPETVAKDTVRAGFRNLGIETDIVFDLINSLQPNQLAKAQISKTTPTEALMGESNVLSVRSPVGISYTELNEIQQKNVRKLIASIINNVVNNGNVQYTHIKFSWWGAIDQNGVYRYRLHSQDILIEADNIKNHIHLVWRMVKKDFGDNPFKN